jgi:argininosuccinate lyase
LGHATGFERDAQRLREAYARIDRSAMGTTVLNGTSWPLNRKRMAQYLGFAAIVDNAYDAGQISSTEHPVEVGAVITGIALHVGHFIEDVMTQYAQPRPWILLQEGGGNTYVSSAMPQKRNPGLMNDTRRDASTAITLAMGPVIRAHNITPGMVDAKDSKINTEMVRSAVRTLQGFDKILKGIVVSPERALEELNSDWTASQELADVLMRKHKLPFRLGHHFASDVVDVAKAQNIKPLDFPYAEAQRIYKDVVKDYPGMATELPMSENELKDTLNPMAIVQGRQTVGGPQEPEMKRMLALATQRLKEQNQWVQSQKNAIDNAAKDLDRDFAKLLKVP